MAQRFNIEEQGKRFEFELGDDGIVWFFEKGLEKPKVNIGQVLIDPDIDFKKAKELAREMLLVSGCIEENQHE